MVVKSSSCCSADTGKIGGVFGLTTRITQVEVAGRMDVTVKSDEEMGVTPRTDFWSIWWDDSENYNFLELCLSRNAQNRRYADVPSQAQGRSIFFQKNMWAEVKLWSRASRHAGIVGGEWPAVGGGGSGHD